MAVPTLEEMEQPERERAAEALRMQPAMTGGPLGDPADGEAAGDDEAAG